MATYTVESLFRQQPDTNLSECTVSGWVRTVRDSKAFGFIELNDGTHFRNLQVVLEDYIHHSLLTLVLQTGVKFVAVLGAIVSIFAVARIALVG